VKFGLSDLRVKQQDREPGLCYAMMWKINKLLTVLTQEKIAIRQVKQCTERCRKRLNLDTGLENQDLVAFDKVVKPAVAISKKRPWSKYTRDTLRSALAIRGRMRKQLELEQELRNILNLNSRRKIYTHKHAILRALDKIEKLLAKAKDCEHLIVVKEAQNFYHRMKEQLSNEPSNLDARIGGPVELSGEWKGESTHKSTGDVTGWDRVTIIFTGNESSSDDLTGTIEGAGFSIFKGKEYSFTLTGEYDLSTRIVKLEKTHLVDAMKVHTYFVDLWWDAAQKKRVMVSSHTMLELAQVQSNAAHRSNSLAIDPSRVDMDRVETDERHDVLAIK